MATPLPGNKIPGTGIATPVSTAPPPKQPDRRLRLEDILKLMVADGLVPAADTENMLRVRTKQYDHPLETIAAMRWKSAKPPHKLMTLDWIVEWLAAKAGVTAMAVVWARELARFRIRAASIAPGFTRTDLLAGMPPEMLEKVTAPVPLKRLGLPEEIAQAAVFIAENDYFNGRSIDIDGGLRL